MRNPIDVAATLPLRFGPPRLRIFPDGWGDLPDVDLAVPGPVHSIDIDWGPPHRVEGADASVRDGTFVSPAASMLPASARVAVVRELAPPHPWATAVLMAAWNDHGFAGRRRLAMRLAAAGIRTWRLEQPLYGARRPTVHGMPVRTVADFLTMGWAAIQEARSLLAAARDLGPVGIAGFSMGGSLTTAVAATSEGPLAVAPLAGSPSPAPVYLDGTLSSGIAWEALGDRGAAARLRQVLDLASVLPLPRPGHPTVIAASPSDGYVPPAAVKALAAHWGVRDVRWVRGGHAGMWWWRQDALAEAVADSLRLLTRGQP